MGLNLYLSFSHTVTEGDNTFYYFRSGLFHGNGFTDLLLLSLDLDFVELLSLPSKIPATIASGTTVQNLNGSSYVVPTDLYLLFIEDMAFASIGGPLNEFLEQGLSRQALCVYAETPASETSSYPSGRSPAVKVPNVTEYPNWYVPSGISTKLLTVASRKSTYPFWTRGIFDYFDAYNPGDYTCEGLPYNIHVTCNPSEMDVWDPPTYYNDAGVWQVDGYYRDIRSDQTTWMGFPLVYNGGGSVQSLDGQAYVPTDNDDPVVYFVSPAVDGKGGGPFLFLTPILMVLGTLFLGWMKGSQQLGGLVFWKLPQIGAPIETGYLLANTNDRLEVNTGDFLEVDFLG
jgi:hypothetical protein